MPHRPPALATGYIARVLRRTFRSELPAMLQEVEAAYRELTQTEPDVELLDLPPPVEYGKGFDELATQRPASAFPRVAIVVGPRAPAGTGSDQLAAEVVHTFLIEWQCAGSTADEATERAWRYGEAILAVVADHSPYFGYALVSLGSPVDEGLATVLAYKPNGETPAAYLAGATAEIALKGLVVR